MAIIILHNNSVYGILNVVIVQLTNYSITGFPANQFKMNTDSIITNFK
jgi:hypothetical protein